MDYSVSSPEIKSLGLAPKGMMAVSGHYLLSKLEGLRA